MNYIERIQRSVDYIEGHLGEEIDLTAVSQQAFMSLASFYRLFVGFTGYTAKEYIRLRRLSQAADRLADREAPAVQIALEAGFESQESFIKAFKAAVGVTPRRYRNSLIRYQFQRMDLMDKHFIVTDNKLSEAYPDIRVLKSFSPMRVAACWVYGEEPEGKAYEKLLAWATKHGLVGPEKVYRMFGNDKPAFTGIARGYEFWITLPPGFPEPADEGIEYLDIPGGDYAVISIRFAQLYEAKARAALFIRDSDYGFAFTPYLEEHLDSIGEDMRMDLYFPLGSDPANKEPEEMDLPELRVAAFPVTDGKEFEQAWKLYHRLIENGASQAQCKLYMLQNGLQKEWAGPIELWVSLPDGISAPEGSLEKTFPGGRYLRFATQFTSMGSEVAHCYDIFTRRGYKHSNNQLIVQWADFPAPWEERTRTYLHYPIK